MGRLFKQSLQISSLVGQFKKINAFLVYSIFFNETVNDKWCLKALDKRKMTYNAVLLNNGKTPFK